MCEIAAGIDNLQGNVTVGDTTMQLPSLVVILTWKESLGSYLSFRATVLMERARASAARWRMSVATEPFSERSIQSERCNFH